MVTEAKDLKFSVLFKTEKVFLIICKKIFCPSSAYFFFGAFSVALLPGLMLLLLGVVWNVLDHATFKGFLESVSDVAPSQVGVVSGHAAHQEL